MAISDLRYINVIAIVNNMIALYLINHSHNNFDSPDFFVIPAFITGVTFDDISIRTNCSTYNVMPLDVDDFQISLRMHLYDVQFYACKVPQLREQNFS